ncbi:PREDICTED: uncharacterized protein LOC108560329 isoform X2 [Nicrophorus vespilloides]|uniref:Uncharacterized protein LOC108560329 isoform X2 n=1 Tax=Nicrophorus vespilloides TaxID=110193 RepID=A0ABM1MFG6_NICVS|nr:PREDICTED: uncharacterized protein LOC108560329 isoform X2 [Nicrophorus vespilloides]
MISLRRQFLVQLLALLVTGQPIHLTEDEMNKDIGIITTTSSGNQIRNSILQYSDEKIADELQYVSQSINRLYSEESYPWNGVSPFKPEVAPGKIRRQRKKRYLTLCHFKLCNMGKRKTTRTFQKISRASSPNWRI